MKINEKTMYAFASSRPVDREGFLLKRGEVNKAFQKRFFVLKGNLLFYYEKQGHSEPLGMIILEGCLVELCEFEEERFCFSINFPGNRRYVLAADNQNNMESWMKSLTCAGYDYMRLMISELQRQLAELDSSSMQSSDDMEEQVMARPPRRQNPFNRGLQDEIIKEMKGNALRPAPPPPINRDTLAHPIKDDNELSIPSKPSQQQDDDFTFITIHEYFGKSWNEIIKSKKEAKEKSEQPLIVF